MKQPQRENLRRGIELMLFVIASVIGIYGLGRGLTGMLAPSQGISLIWLAVTGVAFIVLLAQMGRVHDTWPRKSEKQSQLQTNEQLAHLPPVQTEER